MEVGLINIDPTFAMARWARLAELETKVVFGLSHTYGSFHIFWTKSAAFEAAFGQ